MSEIIILHAGETARLDPTRGGFAHGFGIFETIRLSGGRLSFWAAHWERMRASAEELQLDLAVDASAVLGAVRVLVAADGLSGGLVKLSLLRDGEGTRLFVYARAAGPVPESAQLKWEPRYPVNENSLLAGHKTHNYMENRALFEASQADGFYDALRTSVSGHLAETTMGNLFFIAGGKLRTPALATGILPGVIRAEVLRIHGAEEGCYTVEALEKAEAVFMTNSSCGILPVTRLAGAGLDLNFGSATDTRIQELAASLAAAEQACSEPL